MISSRINHPPVPLNGKLRPLGIPTLEDKTTQLCVSKIPEAIFEQEFQAFSSGYRPKVGALDAVKGQTFGVFGFDSQRISESF